MSERIFQRVSTSDMRTWLTQHADVLILDARDAASHAAAHLEGSVLLDGRNFEALLMRTPRSRPIFIYCYRGNASQSYAQQFADFGFSQVADLIGGWEAHQIATLRQTETASGPLTGWLVAHGFSGIDTPSTHGNTPLMHAAWKGDLPIVEALLSYGVRLDAVNNDGNTALWLACVSNDPAIVRRIARAGARIDHANTTGATCLMYAASSSKPDIVAVLLELGADPDLRSQDDFSALDMAASIQCLRLLRHARHSQAAAAEEGDR